MLGAGSWSPEPRAPSPESGARRIIISSRHMGNAEELVKALQNKQQRCTRIEALVSVSLGFVLVRAQISARQRQTTEIREFRAAL
jgi:hypothetical protein